MSGFASKTHQKSYGSVVGYNSKSTGGTLGIDTKISESCLLGLAATQAHSVLKHFDSLGGNKTSGSNTVISLYGLKELHGHWAVQGNAAYGWSNSNSVAIRRGRTKTVAYAKHKSDFFSGAMQLGKRLHVESLVIDPAVGVSYSQFNDKGYKEYGINIVPWYVAKRFSYNIEGLIGARFSMPYHAHSSDWRYVPSISSYAHITIKDKKGVVHTSLDGTSSGVKLVQPKASKVWYSGGASLMVASDRIELEGSWELQLNKKYVSNHGTIKVRWLF